MEETELTLKDLIIQLYSSFRFLLTKWKIIIIVGFIGGGIGLIKSIMATTEYNSTLKFVVEEEGKTGGGLASLASSFGFGSMGGGSVFSSSNIMEFMKTRSMVEGALLQPVREKRYSKKTYAELYMESYKMNEGGQKGVHFKIGDNREEFSRQKDSLLGVIYTSLIEQRQLVISQPNEDNSILHIDVKTCDEVFSKNFSLELMEIVSQFYLKSKTEKSKAHVELLERQVDSVKNVLYASMSGAASSADNVFGLNPAMNVKRVSSTKQQTQAQISAIVLQELVKNLELAKMKLMDETPVINIIEKPIYPLKKQKSGKLKGIIVGGFLAGIFCVVFLLIRRYLKSIQFK